MTTWRIWPSGNGGALLSDTSAYSLSAEFAVTQSGCTITGYWRWCPTSGSTAAKTFSLWSVTTGTTGTRITAANATGATEIAGAWNFTACTPTALTSGQRYRAEITFAGGSNWVAFTDSGFPSDIVNGPLTCYSSANATGGIQGGYVDGSTPAFTTSNDTNTNFWIDVLVDDGVPAGTDSSPGYAGSASDLGGGSGSWVNPTNADGAPDATYAVWTA